MRAQIKRLRNNESSSEQAFIREKGSAYVIIKNKKAYWGPDITPITKEDAIKIKNIGLDDVKIPPGMENKLIKKLNDSLKNIKKNSPIKNSN